MSETHALMRTSPKGQPFVGTCMKCGMTNLTSAAVNEECENTASMTQEEVMLNAMRHTPDEAEEPSNG